MILLKGRRFWPNTRRLAVSLLVLVCFSAKSGAKDKFARGDMSPFTGNQALDLVTVHVHIAAQLKAEAALYDSGSIVVPNLTPKKGEGQQPCGSTAAYCVCAPGAWVVKYSRFFSGGGPQLLRGNEIAYGYILLGKEITWLRLPGPLVVSLHVTGDTFRGINTGAVESDEIMTKAGSTYDFDIKPEEGSRDITPRITPSKLLFPRPDRVSSMTGTDKNVNSYSLEYVHSDRKWWRGAGFGTVSYDDISDGIRSELAARLGHKGLRLAADSEHVCCKLTVELLKVDFRYVGPLTQRSVSLEFSANFKLEDREGHLIYVNEFAGKSQSPAPARTDQLELKAVQNLAESIASDGSFNKSIEGAATAN